MAEGSRSTASERRARARAAGLLLGLVMAGGTTPALADPASRAQAVIDGADLTHQATFAYACPAATWERILDEPLLLAALWEAYGFAPAYRVSARGDTLHVVDPTGLVGDAVPCARTPGGGTWMAQGRLDHWAVPFFNEGEAVFVLQSRSTGSRTGGTLTVHVRAASAVGRLVLKAGRGLLASHVDNRVTHNLVDAGRIVEAIHADPAGVAGLLDGARAARFTALFAPGAQGAAH
ncbi:MAG: hypothetical protein AB1505_01580 [Candidatus Latescibacterota bacterium]